MYLVGIGLILVLMRWFEYGPVATLSWWSPWFWGPFAGAVAWWIWADWSGYTKRKAVERENQMKEKRIERNREAIRQRIRGR